MADELSSLVVSFEANIDSLTTAISQIGGIFDAVAASAETSSVDMTTSIENVAESFSAITEGASQISASIEENVAAADESLSTLTAAADDAASQSGGAFSGFNIGGMINQVGMGIFSLQAMGNMAVQTASGLLGPASAAENTQASFSNLLGSTQAASNELDKLNQFAAKTQFKTQDIDNMASSMIAFKTPTQDIIPELSAVGDALTAVGRGTPAEMQSVVDILGKIGIQGKLTQGDITQLGTHGINALDLIAEGTGKTTDQIQAMIKNGTLPANDAIDALTKGIEKNPVYSGGMAKQSNTLSGQLSTLSSDWDQVMAAMMKPALPMLEDGLGKLTTLLTSPSFKQFAVTVGTDIVTGITDVITGITKLVAFGESVAQFFEHNQLAAHALLAILIGLGAGVGVFAAVQIPVLIAGFIAWATTAGAAALATLAAAAPFILIGAVVAAVVFGIIEAVQHWGDITKWFQGVWGGFSSWFMGILSNIGNFVIDTWRHIQDGFHAAVDFIVGLAVNFGKTLFEVIIGPVGLLVIFIIQHWSQIGDFLHQKWQDIQNIFSGVESFFASIGEGMWSGIKGGINLIISGLNDFIGFLDGIQIHIPAIGVGPVQTPAFDWGGLGIPQIPMLAAGGIVAPGSVAVAGDAGPELVFGGTSGLSVFSNSQSQALMAGGGRGETHVHIHLDGREMASFLVDPIMDRVVKQIRLQGGRMVVL